MPISESPHLFFVIIIIFFNTTAYYYRLPGWHQPAVGLSRKEEQPLLHTWAVVAEAPVSQHQADTLHVHTDHMLLDASSCSSRSQAPTCSWSSLPTPERSGPSHHCNRTQNWFATRPVSALNCLEPTPKSQGPVQTLWNSTSSLDPGLHQLVRKMPQQPHLCRKVLGLPSEKICLWWWISTWWKVIRASCGSPVRTLLPKA